MRYEHKYWNTEDEQFHHISDYISETFIKYMEDFRLPTRKISNSDMLLLIEDNVKSFNKNINKLIDKNIITDCDTLKSIRAYPATHFYYSDINDHNIHTDIKIEYKIRLPVDTSFSDLGISRCDNNYAMYKLYDTIVITFENSKEFKENNMMNYDD